MDSQDSNQWFRTTHWSMVLAARDENDSKASDALADLCRTYWQPLYAFLRRSGNSPHDSQDLTQAFFAKLIDKRYLKSVEQEKGRFRSFLLVAIKHFVSNQRDYDRAAKRGGGRKQLSLNYAEAERMFAASSRSGATLEDQFEFDWALAVLNEAIAVLTQEFQAAKKIHEFDQLKCFLVPSGPLPSFQELGEVLGLSESGARSAVHRLRRRYRRVLRDQVAQTVGRQEDVDDELRQLMNILSRN